MISNTKTTNTMKSIFFIFFVGIISACQSSSLATPNDSTNGSTNIASSIRINKSIVNGNGARNLEDFDLGAWASDLWDEFVGGRNDFDDDDDDGSINWGNDGAWDDWFSALMNSNGDIDGFDFCPIVELAIGMTPTFGIEADCDCRGDFGSGLEVDCAFNECALGSEVCGSVGLNFVFGGPDGLIEASVCADFYEDNFKETCFSYSIDMRDDNNDIGGGGGGLLTHTCEATYGGEQCECGIENFCLNVDCSSLLPGAAVDTCQLLSMTGGSDLANWVPAFDIFQSDFELDSDAVAWQILNYDELDWDNFNVSAIQWSNSDMMTKSWTDLIGGNLDGVDVGDGIAGIFSSGVCKLMSQVVKLTDELGIEGSCTCDETDGLTMSCEFSDLCINQVVDIGVSDIGNNNDALCGNVSMNLTFESLAQVDANICIEYSDYPETCYSYPIPVADQGTPRECNATYGEGNCRCTMDENFCMSVDCTEFEPLALTDTCQVVSLDGALQPERLMLGFKVPEEGTIVNDGLLASQSISLGVVESGSATILGFSSIALCIIVGTTVLLSHLM